MTLILRALGLRGILLILAILAMVAMAVRIDVVTAHRDTAVSKLTSAETNLAVARADADRIAQTLETTRKVLADERDRAVAAERNASRLREQIARDAGTDRDGKTAPVLEDTIRKLQERSSISDGQSPSPSPTSASRSILTPVFVVPLARNSLEWSITVVVAGKVELIANVKDQAACLLAVAAVVEEIKARPEFESELTGRVLVVCSSNRRFQA